MTKVHSLHTFSVWRNDWKRQTKLLKH